VNRDGSGVNENFVSGLPGPCAVDDIYWGNDTSTIAAPTWTAAAWSRALSPARRTQERVAVDP
jgi:hypothetical protein